MRVTISSAGETVEAPVSSVFGRCPVYLFVDTETIRYEAVSNPALSASRELASTRRSSSFAGGPVFSIGGGTVRQAVELFRSRRLAQVPGATAGVHAGMAPGEGGHDPVLGGRACPCRGRGSCGTPGGGLRAEGAAGMLRKGLGEINERLGNLQKGGAEG